MSGNGSHGGIRFIPIAESINIQVDKPVVQITYYEYSQVVFLVPLMHYSKCLRFTLEKLPLWSMSVKNGYY